MTHPHLDYLVPRIDGGAGIRLRILELSHECNYSDVTHNTGVTLCCASKRRFQHFFTRNQRVHKVMLPHKA